MYLNSQVAGKIGNARVKDTVWVCLTRRSAMARCARRRLTLDLVFLYLLTRMLSTVMLATEETSSNVPYAQIEITCAELNCMSGGTERPRQHLLALRYKVGNTNGLRSPDIQYMTFNLESASRTEGYNVYSS
jgi:hypothetical protein